MSVVTHPQFTRKKSKFSSKSAELKEFSQYKKASVELKILMFLNNSSCLCSLLLIGTVLTVFGLTVTIPKTWHQEYVKLKRLQREERQLTAANETIKNELLDSVEANQPHLVYPKPKNTVFLTPQDSLKIEFTKDVVNQSNSLNPLIDSPVAY